jgi:hypothetical protein
MATEPRAGIAAERYNRVVFGSCVFRYRLHQASGRSFAAQRKRGLNMRDHYPVAASNVLGKRGKAVFNQFKSVLPGVVRKARGNGCRHVWEIGCWRLANAVRAGLAPVTSMETSVQWV